MPLPPNVLRSADHSYQSYGALPEGYGCAGVELETFDFQDIGAHLEEVPPGCCSAPLHHHLLEEEVFMLLSGTLTARERLPDGARRSFALTPGDVVVYAARTGLAHQFYNPGPEPARFLAVSTATEGHEIAVYPNSGKVMLRGLGFVGVVGAGEEAVAEAQAAAQQEPVKRVAVARAIEGDSTLRHVSSPRFLEERDLGGTFGLPLSMAGGAEQVFLNRDRLPPGARSGPLHAHSAEEELLYVLSGHPTLRQRRMASLKDIQGPEERVALQPGDFVHWAPGDAVAHQVLNESDEDVIIIVIGTRRQADVCVLPETGEVAVPALKLRGRLTELGYWVGE